MGHLERESQETLVAIGVRNGGHQLKVAVDMEGNGENQERV